MLHKCYMLAILVVLGIITISIVMLPDYIAIHFGKHSYSDIWACKLWYASVMMGLLIMNWCLIYFSPRVVFWVSPKWVSIPNRTYWLDPQRREITTRKLKSLMDWYGLGSTIFIGLIMILLYHANTFLVYREECVVSGFDFSPLFPRLNFTAFYMLLWAFVIFMCGWCVYFFMTFRLPKGKPTNQHDIKFQN